MFAAWFRSMKSRLMMADYMDMWLDPVPDREWSRVVSAGVVSLTRLPADVVIPESRERWVAGDVVRLAATELEALEQQGVTVAAEAREAVARYQSRPE
jgi:hypothetical protein